MKDSDENWPIHDDQFGIFVMFANQNAFYYTLYLWNLQPNVHHAIQWGTNLNLLIFLVEKIHLVPFI